MKPSVAGLILVFFASTLSGQKVPAVTGSNVTQAQAQEALDFHNKARKEVRTAPLSWSPELAAYAQAWADSLAKWGCNMAHRSSKNMKLKSYGENIYWSSGSSATALDASEGWYSEIEKYVYGALTPTNWSGTGHYTQMVWSNTTAVGIGVTVCDSGGMIIVANYDPPGNYMGQKPY